MKFLIESINYEDIKNELISNNYDLESNNGGQCNEVTAYIEKNKNLKQSRALVLNHKTGGFINNNHYINIDENKIIDFTASQFKPDLPNENIPCPNIATYNPNTKRYESDLLDYEI